MRISKTLVPGKAYSIRAQIATFSGLAPVGIGIYCGPGKRGNRSIGIETFIWAGRVAVFDTQCWSFSQVPPGHALP